jgi:hypothetical protein
LKREGGVITGVPSTLTREGYGRESVRETWKTGCNPLVSNEEGIQVRRF